MTIIRTYLGILAGACLASVASAQVEVVLTGSTAFRSITLDRAQTLFDASGFTAVTNTASTGLQSYRGTMAGKIPSLGSTPVTIRFSFSGSASGMLAVKNQTPLTCAEFPGPGMTVNKVPDLALSDVYPASATPPIAESAFNRIEVGVVPFAWVVNNSLAGINNITRDQALLLLTASGSIAGIDGMPATYLGGSSPNPVYLLGRDSGSGTRISTHKVVGFTGLPSLFYYTNGAYLSVADAGYSSGGLERTAITNGPASIGYLGLADFLPIADKAHTINYDGVAYSPANVANGSYAFWGYEHMVNRNGGLSANQTLVKNALVAAMTDATYQTSNTNYSAYFVSVSSMQVKRGTDGGPITSKNF
jgi:hypothetical protein